MEEKRKKISATGEHFLKFKGNGKREGEISAAGEIFLEFKEDCGEKVENQRRRPEKLEF